MRPTLIGMLWVGEPLKATSLFARHMRAQSALYRVLLDPEIVVRAPRAGGDCESDLATRNGRWHLHINLV